MSVINYAHRGASQYYPENTLWAFYSGLDMGANGIETDIQRTLDGVLVLHHDDTLERVAGVKGSVADFSYDELLEMDFGAFKSKRFKGEKIVTLDTFLLHFGQKDLSLALEIKQTGIEEQVLKSIDDHNCRENAILTSFIWESMVALRALDKEISMGFLTDIITKETLDKLDSLNIGQICPRIDLADEAAIKLARNRGFSIRFWGVKTEELMHRALMLKGDGMTVDFPDKLTEALKI